MSDSGLSFGSTVTEWLNGGSHRQTRSVSRTIRLSLPRYPGFSSGTARLSRRARRSRRNLAAEPRAVKSGCRSGSRKGQNRAKWLNFIRKMWWKGRDSNPRPRHYESGSGAKRSLISITCRGRPFQFAPSHQADQRGTRTSPALVRDGTFCRYFSMSTANLYQALPWQ